MIPLNLDLLYHVESRAYSRDFVWTLLVHTQSRFALVVQPKRMVPIRFEKLLHKINMIVD
jgi:hypothetical protein